MVAQESKRRLLHVAETAGVLVLLGTGAWMMSRARQVEVDDAHTNDRASAAVTARDSLQEPGRAPGMQRTKAASPAIDWPGFLGRDQSGVSLETGLKFNWERSGPPRLWQRPIGLGYSAPAIAGGRLVILSREGDEEVVEALDAARGESIWEYRYPTSYKCPFDYSSGPYSTPTIVGNRVLTYGAQGVLHCLSLENGDVLWCRRLYDEYQVKEGLFAAAASPVVFDGRVILNVGGAELDAGVVALDLSTGETRWTSGQVHASCSTARIVEIHGRPTALILADEGLVSLDPRNGRIDWLVPFKAKSELAVNACLPLVWENLVMISQGPGREMSA